MPQTEVSSAGRSAGAGGPRKECCCTHTCRDSPGQLQHRGGRQVLGEARRLPARRDDPCPAPGGQRPASVGIISERSRRGQRRLPARLCFSTGTHVSVPVLTWLIEKVLCTLSRTTGPHTPRSDHGSSPGKSRETKPPHRSCSSGCARASAASRRASEASTARSAGSTTPSTTAKPSALSWARL